MGSDGQFSFMTEPPSLEEVLRNDSYQSVRAAATRLQDRLHVGTASDSVLTASRALIETVCKTLLDLLDVEYDAKADLQDISKQLLKSLDLHPSTQTQEALRQVCQGAINMINGIAFLRNAHGDAHGTGQEAEAIPFRDAELCAYLSFVFTRYCVQSYEARIARKRGVDLSPSEETQLVAAWSEIAKKDKKAANPDNLPYSEPLEEIAQLFTQKTGIVLPRRDIFLLLMKLRKASRLPKPELDD